MNMKRIGLLAICLLIGAMALTLEAAEKRAVRLNYTAKTYQYELTPLPYAYDALEPYIDAETMRLHHDKHLQTYTDNLNKALEKHPEFHNQTLENILKNLDKLPESIRNDVRNNGGGVYNHDLYFSLMTPDARPAAVGRLAREIDKTFGSFSNFKKEFQKAAEEVFGSGWAWLAVDAQGTLKIVTTANQDCVLSWNMRPVLAVDVWEHAYYLKHQNKRADYLSAWWNVVNWDKAEELFLKSSERR